MKIDVIIPAKNPLSIYGETTVKRCLTSILNQTYQDFKILICNYGDRTEINEMLKDLNTDKIEIISGAISFTNALNLGLKAATGNLIARHDLDDFSDETRFEKQVNYLKTHKGIKLLGTLGYSYTEQGIDYFPQNDRITDPQDILIYFLKYNVSQIVETNYVMNPFIHGSVMFHRDLLNTLGFYNERYTQAQDLDLWCRILAQYNTAILPERLYYWRYNEESTTNGKKDLTVKLGWEIFNKHFNKLRERADFIREKKEFQKVHKALQRAKFSI